MESKKNVVIILLVIALAIALIIINETRNAYTPVIATDTPSTPDVIRDASLDEFTQCLTDSGVKLFGAWWCPHCESQRDAFGDSLELLDYTECSLPNSQAQTPECEEGGITAYPTWRFADGSEQGGVAPFELLSEKTGCSLPPTTPTEESVENAE